MTPDQGSALSRGGVVHRRTHPGVSEDFRHSRRSAELRSSFAVDRAASSASWPTPAPGEILLNLHLQPARAQIARDEPSRFAAFGNDGGQERLNRGHTKPRPLSASRWGLCRNSWEGAGTGSRRIRSALSVSPSGDQNQCRGRGACVANGSESESKKICVY